MVGMMKGLTAKLSHQQGPPLLQVTTRKKSRRLREVLTLKHSNRLLTATVSGFGTWGNKTAQQVSNHTLLSTVAQTGSGACNSRHSL